MHVDELVESILVSVQWDRWRFPLPYAKPLLKQNVAVVSHGHMDHWHPNLWWKDLVLLSKHIEKLARLRGLKNALIVDGSVSLGRVAFTPIDGRLLRLFVGAPISDPHAVWWLASSHGVRVLFVGDMNVADVTSLTLFINEAFRRNQPLHGAILPSFGGTYGHGSEEAMQLTKGVAEAAALLRRFNIYVGAVPHPIASNWADFNAVRA